MVLLNERLVYNESYLKLKLNFMVWIKEASHNPQRGLLELDRERAISKATIFKRMCDNSMKIPWKRDNAVKKKMKGIK